MWIFSEKAYTFILHLLDKAKKKNTCVYGKAKKKLLSVSGDPTYPNFYPPTLDNFIDFSPKYVKEWMLKVE